MRLATLITLVLLLAPASASAVQPDEVLDNPVLEARARALSTELRCLVCQNQSIDDSAAPLARDLRLLVRERLKDGDSDEAVKSYLVARYGDFVLLKPPFEPRTLLLWLGPPAVLAMGSLAIVLGRRKARHGSDPKPLDVAEQARLAALTGDPT